jgi:hypothetical protein
VYVTLYDYHYTKFLDQNMLKSLGSQEILSEHDPHLDRKAPKTAEIRTIMSGRILVGEVLAVGQRSVLRAR